MAYYVLCQTSRDLDTFSRFLSVAHLALSEKFFFVFWHGCYWLRVSTESKADFSLLSNILTVVSFQSLGGKDRHLPTGARLLTSEESIARYGQALLAFCQALVARQQPSDIEDDNEDGEELQSEERSADEDSGSDLESFIANDAATDSDAEFVPRN